MVQLWPQCQVARRDGLPLQEGPPGLQVLGQAVKLAVQLALELLLLAARGLEELDEGGEDLGPPAPPGMAVTRLSGLTPSATFHALNSGWHALGSAS